MSAALDIQLVAWLSKEKDKEKLPRIDDFVSALKKLHDILDWPKPIMNLKIPSGPSTSSAEDASAAASVAAALTPESPTALRSNKESKDSGYSSTMVVDLGQNDDTASVISEITSIWEETNEPEAEPIVYLPPAPQSSKKLEVQMRYLLQIFTEANCLDFSLLLSVLLLDATSVNRVCTAALRSVASLSICRQLKNGLTDLTRWSFNECLGYRSFMLSCGEDLKALERFVATQESIPDLERPPKVATIVRSSSNVSEASVSSVRLIRGPITPPGPRRPLSSDLHPLPVVKRDAAAPKLLLARPETKEDLQESTSSSSCAIM